MRWCSFSTNKQDLLDAVAAAEVVEKLGLRLLVQSPQFVSQRRDAVFACGC